MAEILETIGPRTGAAPYTVTLSEIGVVYPESVFCHFNGASASGSFLAALTVKAQNGTIIARYFPDTTLAAGDTADVTYSPFFRSAASAPVTPTFSALIATLAATHDLRGYWRLGEGASPYADTSGNAGGPADMTIQTHGVAMTQDYTPGALPHDQDDGAVAFNATAYNIQGDVLLATNSRFQLTGLASYSLVAFVKPVLFSAQPLQVLGTFSPGNGGYAMWVFSASGNATFHIADSASSSDAIGSALPLNQWSFLVMVYGPTANRMRIYINGVLDTDVSHSQSLAAFSTLFMGGNGSGGPVYASFDGAVDEVSVWGDELTAAEVAALAAAAGY